MRIAALVAALILGEAQGQTLYPKMAPLDQYLIQDRDAEVALARSAAPESISKEAEVLVLTSHGYETAVKGTNGFVCVVERSWMAPMDFPEFWNPKIRGAACYNAVAARSVLPIIRKRTEMALAGVSNAEMGKRLKAAFASKELRVPEPGNMCYMMSHHSYLTDSGSHNLAHVMIFTPMMKGTSWGADLPGSPVSVALQGSDAEPYTLFVIGVARWSDAH